MIKFIEELKKRYNDWNSKRVLEKKTKQEIDKLYKLAKELGIYVGNTIYVIGDLFDGYKTITINKIDVVKLNNFSKTKDNFALQIESDFGQVLCFSEESCYYFSGMYYANGDKYAFVYPKSFAEIQKKEQTDKQHKQEIEKGLWHIGDNVMIHNNNILHTDWFVGYTIKDIKIYPDYDSLPSREYYKVKFILHNEDTGEDTSYSPDLRHNIVLNQYRIFVHSSNTLLVDLNSLTEKDFVDDFKPYLEDLYEQKNKMVYSQKYLQCVKNLEKEHTLENLINFLLANEYRDKDCNFNQKEYDRLTQQIELLESVGKKFGCLVMD